MKSSIDKKIDGRIILAHGGGGQLTKSLLKERIIPRLSNDILNALDDSAILGPLAGSLCMTTDSFVVQPLEFPGGDIGRLAVCGTVNDIAVMGAEPKALSLSLIIEEGLKLSVLDKIVDSIAATAKEAGVSIVTGDTKVVEYGRGDGLTITTAGIGAIFENMQLGAKRICPDDVIIINGGIAEHGLAIMSVREGIGFDTELKSDVAPLNGLIGKLCNRNTDIKFMRDPTRSGLAGVAVDIAEMTGFTVEMDEDSIPISRTARHATEMLGFDPLTVANEGKVVMVVSSEDAGKALAACRKHDFGKHASIIGRIVDRRPALVELITRAGGRRIVQLPYGEELPRIC